MVVPSHGNARDGSPCAGRRVPDFSREDGAAVAELRRRSIAADDHDLAVREHHRVGKSARVRHRTGIRNNGRRASQIDCVSGFRGCPAARRGESAAYHHASLVIHHPCALFRELSAGNGDVCISQAAVSGCVYPVHPVRGTGVKDAAVRREEKERVPALVEARFIQNRLPIDARVAPPSGGRIPKLGGALAIGAGGCKNLAGRQCDAGVVPPAVVHVLNRRPSVRAPVEDARPPVASAATIDQQATVRKHGDAAAEHVVSVAVHLRECARFGVPNGSVRELGSAWKCVALIRCKREQTSIRKQGTGDRNVWCPRNYAAPRSHRLGIRANHRVSGRSSIVLRRDGCRHDHLVARRRRGDQ